MLYRKLGKTGLTVSEIGMGLEHLLPLEQDIVTATIRAAAQGGVNYFDCLSSSDFERKDGGEYIKLGNALRGIREQSVITYIANADSSAEVIDASFARFLEQVGTDHIDIFMIACCDKVRDYDRVTGMDSLLTLAQQMQQAGKARFIGMSTHSTVIAMKMIQSGCFDVLMFPINPAFDVVTDEDAYIDKDLGKLWDAAYDVKPETTAIYKRKSVFDECAKRQIGLVAMKPFAAGWLFRPDLDVGFTPINLVSYALSQNGVTTVVPGCTSPEQIKQILRYHTCNDDEKDFSMPVSKSRWTLSGHCLYCGHCLPCPAGIDIPAVNRYLDIGGSAPQVENCTQCGICENRCPFNVPVRERIRSSLS